MLIHRLGSRNWTKNCNWLYRKTFWTKFFILWFHISCAEMPVRRWYNARYRLVHFLLWSIFSVSLRFSGITHSHHHLQILFCFNFPIHYIKKKVWIYKNATIAITKEISELYIQRSYINSTDRCVNNKQFNSKQNKIKFILPMSIKHLHIIKIYIKLTFRLRFNGSPQ